MLLVQHLRILNHTLMPASWQRYWFKILKPPSRMAFFVFVCGADGTDLRSDPFILRLPAHTKTKNAAGAAFTYFKPYAYASELATLLV
jgi:hypothetical protein